MSGGGPPRALCAILALGSLACTTDPARDSGEPSLDGPEWAIPTDGCELSPGSFEDVTIQQTEVPAVMRVSWRTAGVAASGLRFTNQDGSSELVATPLGSQGEHHEALVIGLPPQADGALRIVSDDGSTTRCSAALGFTTGGLPPSFPPLDATVHMEGSLAPGFIPTTINAVPDSYLVVLDKHGRPVWWKTTGYTPRLLHDPEAMTLTAWGRDPASEKDDEEKEKEKENAEGGLTSWSYDGESYTFRPSGVHSIDHAALPEGGFAVLALEQRAYRTAEGRRNIIGGRIVELRDDGSTVPVWSVFDLEEPDLSVEYPVDASVGEHAEDWTHVNAMGYDPVQDAYYVSISFWDTIARVDRPTGSTTWLLGGERSELEEEGQLVSGPHDISPLPDGGLLVFNRWIGAESCAAGTEIAIDAEAGTARAVQHIGTEPCVDNPYIGGANRLSNGNNLMVYSSAGRMIELTAEGALVKEIDLPTGAWFGYAAPFTSFYPEG